MTSSRSSVRLSRRRLLQGIGLAALLLAGCAVDVPGQGSTETPSAEPSAAVVPKVLSTIPLAPSPTTPPSVTVAPSPTVVSAPTPEPRGGLAGKLLFTRRGNLYLMSGTTSKQLTNSGDQFWPRWSPDASRIAIVRRGDAYSDLQLLDAEGRNPLQLTKHQSKAPGGSKEYAMSSVWATWPAWDPSGGRLLYGADVSGSQMSLWQVDVKPDAKPSAPRQLPGIADLGANIESPVFAPDGKSIIFCLSFDTPTQLWVMNLAPGTRAPLTDGKQTVYDPAWSPDGKALVASIVDGPRSTLHHLDIDGKDRGQLGLKLPARAPTWSPDGKQLAFIGEEGGRFNVYVVEVAGNFESGYTAGDARRLTNDGDIDAPSGLSWAR